MPARQLWIGGAVCVAALVAGLVLDSLLLVLLGAFGLLTVLRLGQLNRWRDPQQREMYTPTYRKAWGDDDPNRGRWTRKDPLE